MIALVDAFTESLGRFEREAYLGRPEDGFAGGLEPCVGEHAEHRRVVEHHVGQELLDAHIRRAFR